MAAIVIEQTLSSIYQKQFPLCFLMGCFVVVYVGAVHNHEYQLTTSL